MSDQIKDQMTIDALKHVNVYKAIVTILLLSAFALVFLFWLIYFREPGEVTFEWVGRLPALNATLNSISTVMLILGFREIKRRNFTTHMKYMIGAFVTSTLFLVSYVLYHNFVGHTPFPGTGIIRPVYFFILITHILLSMAVVPLILSSFYFAFAGKFQTHRKLSKITFPVWLYVSVTGVMIFFILNAHT